MLYLVFNFFNCVSHVEYMRPLNTNITLVILCFWLMLWGAIDARYYIIFIIISRFVNLVGVHEINSIKSYLSNIII